MSDVLSQTALFKRFLFIFCCAVLLIHSVFAAGSRDTAQPAAANESAVYSEAANAHTTTDALTAERAAADATHGNLVQNGAFTATPNAGRGSAADSFDAEPWKAGTFGSYTLPDIRTVIEDAEAAAPYVMLTALDDASRG